LEICAAKDEWHRQHGQSVACKEEISSGLRRATDPALPDFAFRLSWDFSADAASDVVHVTAKINQLIGKLPRLAFVPPRMVRVSGGDGVPHDQSPSSSHHSRAYLGMCNVLYTGN
jgi:hypothetical protein